MMIEKHKKTDKLNYKKLGKFFLRIILTLILCIYLASVIVLVSSLIFDSIFFKNVYSYENIRLYTANPLDENQVEDILKDVFVRINKSSLYDDNKTYRVCLSNSKSSELLYFKPYDFMFGIVDMVNNIKNNRKIDISSFEIYDRTAGYVRGVDFLGISYVRELDVITTSHELTHQMVIRSINNPIISLYIGLKNGSINEGYANLVAYGEDFEYIEPDFIGSSGSYKVEEVLHDDGVYYKQRYFTVNWESNYYFNEYSSENMLIVKELLSEKDILKLLTGFNNKNNMEKATYNYFLSRGFHKVDNIDALEGEWFRFSCDCNQDCDMENYSTKK